MARKHKKQRTPADRAPVCRVCEAPHWSHEPHVFGKPKRKPKAKAPRLGKGLLGGILKSRSAKPDA